MAAPKRAKAQTSQIQQADQDQDQDLVVCPRCAGNKRVMDFRGGDRTTGELAGWKAIECPGCGGMGSVDERTAATILAKMEKDSPA